ncbi:hypothetical protein ABZ863_19090 [Saccharomonospora sp. NPDC046836]|uniref:alpha/beta fold hydrolase n=1 Tax=Saccharomonospora sp. NPDC046836 TaxID=3156921 RepID=UPI0033D0DC6D
MTSTLPGRRAGEAPPPLAELAGFARLHARALGLDPVAAGAVLDRLVADGDEAAWPRVWSRLGERRLAAGRPLEACRCFVLARFPFPADPDRLRAGEAAVRAFDSWRLAHGGIDRLDLSLPAGQVAAWTAGVTPGRPVLLVMGGIISVKEQWAPFLTAARRLRAGVIVTEMPSVGENTTPYLPGSVELIPEILDRLGAAVCAAGVHVVGLSFAGHLALAAARHDPRIRSVHTVGAPVSAAFTDRDSLPSTTRATVSHLSGGADLTALALDRDALAELRVPVRYVASRRDEIIPRREWELLAESLVDFRWVEFDDVHGSPAHLTDTRLWLLRGVLEALGDRRASALGLLLALRGKATRTGVSR